MTLKKTTSMTIRESFICDIDKIENDEITKFINERKAIQEQKNHERFMKEKAHEKELMSKARHEKFNGSFLPWGKMEKHVKDPNPQNIEFISHKWSDNRREKNWLASQSMENPTKRAENLKWRHHEATKPIVVMNKTPEPTPITEPKMETIKETMEQIDMVHDIKREKNESQQMAGKEPRRRTPINRDDRDPRTPFSDPREPSSRHSWPKFKTEKIHELLTKMETNPSGKRITDNLKNHPESKKGFETKLTAENKRTKSIGTQQIRDKCHAFGGPDRKGSKNKIEFTDGVQFEKRLRNWKTKKAAMTNPLMWVPTSEEWKKTQKKLKPMNQTSSLRNLIRKDVMRDIKQQLKKLEKETSIPVTLEHLIQHIMKTEKKNRVTISSAIVVASKTSLTTAPILKDKKIRKVEADLLRDFVKRWKQTRKETEQAIANGALIAATQTFIKETRAKKSLIKRQKQKLRSDSEDFEICATMNEREEETGF